MNKLLGSRRILGGASAVATLVAALSWSAPARADGGIPRAYNVLFEPGNPSHIVIRSQYWGLFNGMDGSSTWTMLCSQAYGGRALDPDNYSTAVAQGGRILVAAQFSGLNISDDTCNWKMVDAFNGESVQAVAPTDTTGKSFIAVTVLGDASGVTSRVYTSSDRGDTWTQLKGTIPKNLSMNGVAVAPSDPMRVYVVGVTTNGGPREIAVSKDGGATFDILPVGTIMTDYDPTQIKPLTVDGILPNDPDTLFVRADGGDMAGATAPDELWVSSDAGKTWKSVYSPMLDLPGFAFTPDGKSVLISGPTEGIKQAALADAVAGKANAFTQIYTGQVWGLAFQGDKLYAGNDDYSMKPPFTVGVSTDGGHTFSQVMNKCEVSFPTCDMSSTMQMVCLEQWTRQGGYVTDYLDTACMEGIANAGAAGVGGGAGASGSMGTGGAPSAGGVSQGGTAGVVTQPQGGVTSDAGAGGEEMHVGVKSSGCSVGAPRKQLSSLASLLAAGAAIGLGVTRRRRSSPKR